MKEVKITIPDNCELVKKGNTYIVKENKQGRPRSWEEFCKRYPKQKGEYFIGINSNIRMYDKTYPRSSDYDKNVCTSKEEAEAFLALIQLRQLRKAWIGDWEQTPSDTETAAILCDVDKQRPIIHYSYFLASNTLSFPSLEMAQGFLNCFRDLCETAKILL